MATREDLFRAAKIIKDYPELDKYTEKAYKSLEEKIWRQNLESSPHGRPWFTSFHASSFPEKEKPCGRLALYTMMDTPNPEPMSPFLRGVADIGQAVEYQIVYRWGLSGITIGGSVPLWNGGQMHQVKFEDRSTWLTGSADAILDLRPEYEYVLPVDVKSKKHEVVEEMKKGTKSYDEKHFYQVQAYMYLCNRFHEEMGWSDIGLKPARGAFIYYASRQDPRFTAEFYVPIDWDVIENGINTLKTWKTSFESGVMPQRDKSWKWTEEPCKWCDMKKYACKPDYKDGVLYIKDSNAIKFSESLRKNYNFEEIEEEVKTRWKE